MVTNQDGLGTDSFPREDFDVPHQHVISLFSSQGIDFDKIFICPHLGSDGCDCRKPRTGLLTRFLAATPIDTESSAVIGDRETDLLLAENIGIRGFLVDASADYQKTWDGIRSALTTRERRATVERKTKETNITADVCLDDEGPIAINTGIGFYDHMLEQIAKHGGFSLQLKCGYIGAFDACANISWRREKRAACIPNFE